MVEVLIGETFGSGRRRPIGYEQAVVVDAEVKENEQGTLRSEGGSMLKKSLTEPTLLEMSDNPTNQELARWTLKNRYFRLIELLSSAQRPFLGEICT